MPVLAIIKHKLLLLLITICLVFSVNECLESDATLETSYPFVDNSLDYYSSLDDCRHKHHHKQELLIISTLDGKLTALDVSAGHTVWSKSLSPDPLLSSTISDFEITRRGRVVRVVPSLDGNLYLYNGKTIDAIPLNADTLLKSSYKLGDDLVITGGQESHISGIDISTGRVFYECGLNGCPSTQLNENETFDDLVLIKRITQTVRAIDPRSGRQKWYFSVTEPQMIETSSSCLDANPISDEINDTNEETNFKIIVPNGFISANIESKHNNKIESSRWSHSFDSPLVHVWHYRNGRLNALNLFDKQKLFGFTNTDFNTNGFEPSVYVGLYRNQWYIQSSDKIRSQISETKTTNDLLVLETDDKKKLKRELLEIEWKPQAIVLNDNKKLDSESDLDLISSPHFSFAITSDNDSKMGYYLFDAIEENETKCLINSSEEQMTDWETDGCEDDNELMQQIIIRSLWYYWREVTAISIVSAFLLNLCYSLLKRKFKTIRQISECEDICSKSESNLESNRTPSPSPSTPSFTSPFNTYPNTTENTFNSRYESDFEPIQVLGRGGFGLVFEAKHLIDESHYAVKRIYLPVRKENRDKVMREVRALSKLDHSGIVRYYNAWVELPPPGWQEDKDKQWDSDDIASTHYNLDDKNKQMAINKMTTNQTKTSYRFKSHEKSFESSFEFTKSKQFLMQTQSNQSFDVVFDENVSSIKVMDCNINGSALESKSSDCNESQSKAKHDLTENNNRPNSLSATLPRYYLFIQMQLCRKDTLKDWLFNNSHNRDLDTALDIFNQIVSAVHYVHSMGLMHRDLKPSNIFFSMDGNIKIGDFGLVTNTAVDEDIHTPGANHSSDDSNPFILNRSSSSHTNRVGTQLYMSPEQLLNHPYSHKVDIFSLGIILFELLVPFKTEMERNIILNNARKQIFPKDFCKKYHSECELLNKLLSRNPDDRPSTLEIKEHIVLKDFKSYEPAIGRQRSRTISLNNGDHL